MCKQANTQPSEKYIKGKQKCPNHSDHLGLFSIFFILKKETINYEEIPATRILSYIKGMPVCWSVGLVGVGGAFRILIDGRSGAPRPLKLLTPVFVVGVPAGDRCDVERHARGKAQVGLPHVRRRRQRCHRHPGDDEDRTGKAFSCTDTILGSFTFAHLLH